MVGGGLPHARRASCAERMDAERVNAEWQTSMQQFTATGGRPDEAFCELEHYFYLGTDAADR